MGAFFNEVFYRPFLNTLVFFYNTIAFHDLGLAIIFLTILIRLILFPLFHKSAHYQAKMQRIQPHLKKIQETHKNDKAKQTQAMMDLYKEHDVNPFSGFLFLLIQLPVLYELYQIFRNVLKPEFAVGLYSFVARPDHITPTFLGLINLGAQSILMVGIAAVAQYFQGTLALKTAPTNPNPSPAEKMTRQMVFMGPVLTFVIFYRLPAAIGLYWAISSLFSIFQQLIINKQILKQHGTVGNIDQKTS